MVLAVVIILLSSQAAHATSVTIPYIFVPNTTIVSAQVNANFSTIAGVVNGSLDNSNLSAGANISLSKLNNTQSFLDVQSASGVLGFGVGQTGDTVSRVGLFSDGAIKWGPGSSTAVDVGLSRSAANTIQLNNGTLGTGTGYIDLGTYGTIINTGIGLVPGGRLYLGTGAPYTDHAAAATLYYGPAVNNRALLYNSTLSAYQLQSFAEVSSSLAALTVSTPYDVYITTSSLTAVTLSFVAWGGANTPPTRGTDAYGRLTQNGTTGALLVGCIELNGVPQTIDTVASRWVSNLYNAVPRALFATDTAPTWTDSSTTVATAHGNTTDGVGRSSFMCTLVNQSMQADVFCTVTVNTLSAFVGLGLNSTTTFSAYNQAYNATAGTTVAISASYAFTPTVGFNYLQRLEAVSAGTGTFGNSSFTGAGNGLSSLVNN